MRNIIFRIVLFSLLLWASPRFGGEGAHAGMGKENLARGAWFTEFFQALRVVVESHQAMLNPKEKPTGLTPEEFAQETAKEFKSLSGIEASAVGDEAPAEMARHLAQLMMSSWHVIDRYQRRIKEAFASGYPAVYLVEEAAFLFEKSSGVSLRLTSLGRKGHEPRSRAHEPDLWEKTTLRSFKEKRVDPWHVVQEPGQLRFLVPLVTEASCLRCHGEPEGILDETGHVREGYHKGELRGGIVVRFPPPESK